MSIGEVLCRKQILFFEGLMDEGRHIHIAIARPTGLHMRNQARSVVITTFGQMDFLSHPPRRQFAPVGGLDIIGRTDHVWGWWDIVIGTKVNVAFDELKLLHPHSSQGLNRPNLG